MKCTKETNRNSYDKMLLSSQQHLLSFHTKFHSSLHQLFTFSCIFLCIVSFIDFYHFYLYLLHLCHLSNSTPFCSASLSVYYFHANPADISTTEMI